MLMKLNTDKDKNSDEAREAIQRDDDGRNHDVFDTDTGLNVINIAQF